MGGLASIPTADISSLGADHPGTLDPPDHLAAAYQATGQLVLAILLFEQPLANHQPVLGACHLNTLATLDNLERVRAGAVPAHQLSPTEDGDLSQPRSRPSRESRHGQHLALLVQTRIRPDQPVVRGTILRGGQQPGNQRQRDPIAIADP
jgi:hypothetical protein